MSGELVAPQAQAADSPSVLSPVRLVILQASPFCNIDCRYCYLGDRLNKTRMSLTTVSRVGSFLSTADFSNEPLTICWHAGEPLAVGWEFYQDAFGCLAETCMRPRLAHNFQTNATLIDENWCTLFKKWSVTIGVSVDGPKEIHDAHRVDRSGRGTFDRTMQGIKQLKDAGIPFTLLCVLTKDMLGHADTLWDFWVSLGVTCVGINVEEVEALHVRSTLFESDHFDQVKQFFARLAERWAESKTLRIRELSEMRSHMEGPAPNTVVHRCVNRAGSIISIDLAGNISTFAPELLAVRNSSYPLKWGNVHHDTWATFIENPHFRRANAEVQAGIEKCRKTCGYFSVCGGGDPSNKLAENGTFDSAETQHCRFHVKAVADVVLQCLERELSLDQKEHSNGNDYNIQAS